jgi:hypothetical protein
MGMMVLRASLCLAAIFSVSACSSVLTESAGAGAGIAGAGIASAVTKNGAVAAGIGIGAQAAALAGTEYLERVVHGAEQQRIADTAGPLPVGSVTAWQVSHDIPIESDEHGRVAVSRMITTSDHSLDCKEIVFSVDTVEDHAPHSDFYTASICRDGSVWKWATAEPATARWGSLQ